MEKLVFFYILESALEVTSLFIEIWLTHLRHQLLVLVLWRNGRKSNRKTGQSLFRSYSASFGGFQGWGWRWFLTPGIFVNKQRFQVNLIFSRQNFPHRLLDGVWLEPRNHQKLVQDCAYIQETDSIVKLLHHKVRHQEQKRRICATFSWQTSYTASLRHGVIFVNLMEN